MITPLITPLSHQSIRLTADDFTPSSQWGIAVWIIISTVREVFASSEELIWPEKIVCGHFDEKQTTI